MHARRTAVRDSSSMEYVRIHSTPPKIMLAQHSDLYVRIHITPNGILLVGKTAASPSHILQYKVVRIFDRARAEAAELQPYQTSPRDRATTAKENSKQLGRRTQKSASSYALRFLL